jgi:hypothetical protein
MKIVSPQNFMEEHFVRAAEGSLPVADADIARTDRGILYYCWQSPCAEIGRLWVYVTEHELMLSTAISHTHVDGFDFRDQNLTNDGISRRIAEAGVAKVAAIMRGDVAFTETFDGDGKKHSSGSCPTERLREGLNYSRQIFGEEMTERAFTWLGEIVIEE